MKTLEQEIQQAALELWQGFRRSILKADFPRYLFIASKSGHVIGTVPKQSFPGLDMLIHTGQEQEDADSLD